MYRALCILMLAASPLAGQAPETILVNGAVVSLDNDSSIHQALAVHDGRILALGTNGGIQDLAGESTEVVDLGGRTVDSGSDRLSHSRDSGRPQLCHRGQLDRNIVHSRGDGAHPGQGGSRGTRRMADRCRWMERRAVRGKTPAEAGRVDGRRRAKPRLRSTGLQLGAPDAARPRNAGHRRRRRCSRTRPLRERPDRRPGFSHRRTLRPAAGADLRGTG